MLSPVTVIVDTLEVVAELGNVAFSLTFATASVGPTLCTRTQYWRTSQASALTGSVKSVFLVTFLTRYILPSSIALCITAEAEPAKASTDTADKTAVSLRNRFILIVPFLIY